MNVMTSIHTGPVAAAMAARSYVDPLDGDEATDAAVFTTDRGLTRLALVAAETGARFQREGSGVDPMAWLLAPRRMFGGSAALEACLSRKPFMRALLLHGLSLGFDADPAEIDALSADGGSSSWFDADTDEREGDRRRSESAASGQRLFTATIVARDGFQTVQAFHASLATDEAEVAGRLYCRMGAASADARIIAGFDPTDPLVGSLVSVAIGDILTLVAADPNTSLAAGLDLNVEQRFLC